MTLPDINPCHQAGSESQVTQVFILCDQSHIPKPPRSLSQNDKLVKLLIISSVKENLGLLFYVNQCVLMLRKDSRLINRHLLKVIGPVILFFQGVSQKYILLKATNFWSLPQEGIKRMKQQKWAEFNSCRK